MTLANSLDAFWLPFTNNRGFKAQPRMFAGAKGMHYVMTEGRRVLDGTAGLWCVNAGHGRERIVEAIRRQAGELDFAPTFQLAHPLAFEFASRVAALAPQGLDQVFFCNSGSEAVDSALKIALAYQRANRAGDQNPPDRSRARLSWRRLRRHFGRGYWRQSAMVRAAAPGNRSSAPHL